jgi:hypothetical protein
MAAQEGMVLNPLVMVERALTQNSSVETLAKLMELAERWQANEARNAYVVAMNAFKKNPPTLIKNKHVQFGNTNYDHATLDNVVDTITAGLSKHGLSHSWKVEQVDTRIKVTCVITHELGHSESVSMEAGADTSGSKNSIQAIGSAVTYLQRYTLLSATGMAAKGTDNDGATIGTTLDISEALEYIANSRNQAELMKFYLPAYEQAQKAKDKPAMQQLLSAKARRTAELS